MTSSIIFLLQVFIVVVVPFAVLRAVRLKGLVPLVVVQILIGIALGPSLFGRLGPDYYYHTFFNKEALTQLSGIASVALLFFGLITGLHLEPHVLRGNGRAFVFVAVASVLIPTGLGFVAGLWIAGRQPTELGSHISVMQFAEAFGICTGVTALPVLGAILHEMNLLGGRIGKLALGIAGVNDAALWVLLALLLTNVAGHAPEGPGLLVTGTVLPVYMVVMASAVRPWIRYIMGRRIRNGAINESGLAILCAVTTGSALVTQALGLHYLLGAFLTGVIMPEELRKPILDRIELITLGLLMPFFFLLTGLRTLIDLNSAALLEIFIVATGVAVIGKVGGTALAARIAGESWPNAFGLGALLQTKGLMEVVVLTILLDGGIISNQVFSALILMAVVSTALAMPLATRMLAAKSRTLVSSY
jgi:Kef-type K+ transport system membrane component KefB